MVAVFAVGLLNWKHGYTLEDSLINCVIAFGVMYVLTEANLYLLEKFGVWVSLDESLPNTSFNVLISDDLDEDALTKSMEENPIKNNVSGGFSGQVEPSLSLGLPDDQIRAEMKNKMGLN